MNKCYLTILSLLLGVSSFSLVSCAPRGFSTLASPALQSNTQVPDVTIPDVDAAPKEQTNEPQINTPEEAKPPSNIQENEMPDSTGAEDAPKSEHGIIENWIKNKVPLMAFQKALAYLQSDTSGKISNREYLTIIDFTVPSVVQRMYLLNFKTGEMKQFFVSHGSGSGGMSALYFHRSNSLDSNMTTPGFHKFAEIYAGQHGDSYRLDGLEERNSNARKKQIVIHAAEYTTVDWILHYGWLGRSQGCPAVSPSTMKIILEKNLTGSLLYNYTILDK